MLLTMHTLWTLPQSWLVLSHLFFDRKEDQSKVLIGPLQFHGTCPFPWQLNTQSWRLHICFLGNTRNYPLFPRHKRWDPSSSDQNLMPQSVTHCKPLLFSAMFTVHLTLCFNICSTSCNRVVQNTFPNFWSSINDVDSSGDLRPVVFPEVKLYREGIFFLFKNIKLKYIY